MWFFPCFMLAVLIIGIVEYRKKGFDVFTVSFVLANLTYVGLLLNVYFTSEKTDISTALFFAFAIFYVFVVPVFSLVFTLLLSASRKFVTK